MLGRKRTLLKVLVSVVLTAIVCWLVLSRTDLSALQKSLTHFSPETLLYVIALVIVGTSLSVWRFRLIAEDLGYRLTVRDSIAAVSLGILAGSIFFQLFGQLIARGAVLSRRGMPVAATLTMTVYERAAAAGVSLLLAVAGGWYIFGRLTLDVQTGGLMFLKISVGLAVATVAGAWIGWGRVALAALPSKIDHAAAIAVVRNVLISLAIQLTTMAAYVGAAHVLAPTVPLTDLAAAATIVMLAASLPISFAGWGVRELSAVVALGVIGVPADAALWVAITIGLSSLLVIACFALVPFWIAVGDQQVTATGPNISPKIDYGTAVAWAIPILAATAVFFQIYVPIGVSNLNVNLADPLAIIGGALFVLGALAAKRRPTWRLPSLDLHIASITAVLTLALVHGTVSIGWTSWAVNNRFLGWFVLIAYAATGATIVFSAGRDGMRVLLRTFAAAACAVISVDLVLVIISGFGVRIPNELQFVRIAGFSQNPNAFGFQILLALCAAICADFRPRILLAAMSLCFLGLYFTASRAMGITAVFVIAFALYTRAVSPRTLILAALVSAAVAFVLQHFPSLFAMPSRSFMTMRLVQQQTYDEASTVERLDGLRVGAAMFLESPLFGQGLGVFIANHIREFGKPLVIHSTPTWLLAETGVVGTAVVAFFFVRVFITEWMRALRGDMIAAFLVLIFLTIGIPSNAHELFYQRSFWLLFGAAMALIPAARKQKT